MPNDDKLRWVDDQLRELEPPSDWRPDTERAFEFMMNRRKGRRTSRHLGLVMLAALVAVIGVVLLSLPWPSLRVLLHNGFDARPAAQQPKVGAVHTGPGPIAPPTAQEPAPPQESPEEPSKSETVTAPILVQRVEPQYSQEAREAKLQGTVELLIRVNVDGTVTFDSVRTSLGYGLDEKAIEAVKQWRYIPGKKNDEPVPTMISVRIHFILR